MSIIDAQGYRLNVGIVLYNRHGKLLLARRNHKYMWQFPQGGLQKNETPEQGMYRELQEELGLVSNQVELVAKTNRWHSYRLPRQYIRHHQKPLCVGQKQRWFLLHFLDDDKAICLDSQPNPEFNEWNWFNPIDPLNMVIFFKKEVYQAVLSEFIPLTTGGGFNHV